MPHAPGTMQDLVPARSAAIETVVVDAEALLYNAVTEQTAYLNGTAAVVWALVDGARSLRDIVALIAEAYPEAADSLTDDVLTTVTSLRDTGALSLAAA